MKQPRLLSQSTRTVVTNAELSRTVLMFDLGKPLFFTLSLWAVFKWRGETLLKIVILVIQLEWKVLC